MASSSKNTTTTDDNLGADVIASARNLRKEYHVGNQRITALNDVSIDIHDKEFITIQGPSGCGKTTLLNLLGLMDTPTSGEVIIKGKRASDMDDDQQSEFRAKNVGFVFQFYNLIEHLTALENVAIALGASGTKDDKKRKELANRVLERVGLGDRLDNMPGELSGGEQQRVAIARAIVNDPAVLIADEPTGDLDTETGQKILALFKDLNEKDGRAILIVTHDPIIGAAGKRRVKMRDYKIISDES